MHAARIFYIELAARRRSLPAPLIFIGSSGPLARKKRHWR